MDLKNTLYNLFKPKTKTKPKENKEPKIVYSKIISLTHCNTESRQKVIKELIKQDDLFDTENITDEPLLCSTEIDECNPFGGKKILKVIVLLNEFICDLGYIPHEYENELYNALNNSDNYSTTIFVSKEKNIYNLKLEITFYKK